MIAGRIIALRNQLCSGELTAQGRAEIAVLIAGWRESLALEYREGAGEHAHEEAPAWAFDVGGEG